MLILPSTEVIPRIYDIKAIEAIEKILKEKRPNCLVCVDFQAFNLKLATFAQSIGIPFILCWATNMGITSRAHS